VIESQISVFESRLSGNALALQLFLLNLGLFMKNPFSRHLYYIYYNTPILRVVLSIGSLLGMLKKVESSALPKINSPACFKRNFCESTFIEKTTLLLINKRLQYYISEKLAMKYFNWCDVKSMGRIRNCNWF